MRPLFRPGSGTILRLALALVPVGALGLYGLGMRLYTSDYYTQRFIVRHQPVPFSHEHHVGQLGLDCRYCHASVELSSYAGVPGASTCMHCHSQIWPEAPVLAPVRLSYAGGEPLRWNRVHNLPDYVYFDHSVHVQRGVGCVSCHGRVDRMPLMEKAQSLEMRWCLDCHEHPERAVRPREEVFNLTYESDEKLGRRLVEANHIRRQIDCYTCHR